MINFKTSTNNGIFKSDIQLALEQQAVLHNLKEFVRQFVESYDTDNVIFGLVGARPQELTTGFMTITESVHDLEEALRLITAPDQAIQLLGREADRTYRVGVVSKVLESSDNPVVNITTLQEI